MGSEGPNGISDSQAFGVRTGRGTRQVSRQLPKPALPRALSAFTCPARCLNQLANIPIIAARVSVGVPDNLRRIAQVLLFSAGVIPGSVCLAGSITLDALRNAAYPSGFASTGEIRLRGGEFHDEIRRRGEVRVVLTNHVAIGTMPDGTGAAAVVLRTTTGGNAAFHELTLMVEGTSGIRWHATAPLGDRIAIESIALRDGDVVLVLREHAEDDPMCCPTVRTETRFRIRGTRLEARVSK